MMRRACNGSGASGTPRTAPTPSVSAAKPKRRSTATRPSSSDRTGPARPVGFMCTRQRARSFTSRPPALHLWFYAMYLMTSTRSGISAKQLERELGVTYKTAWRIFHLIRDQLMDQDDDEPLSGEVEMDETYVGGKPRLADKIAVVAGHRPAQANKARSGGRTRRRPVFGMVERGTGGRVRAYVVPSTQRTHPLRHTSTRPSSPTRLSTQTTPGSTARCFRCTALSTVGSTIRPTST